MTVRTACFLKSCGCAVFVSLSCVVVKCLPLNIVPLTVEG